MERKLSQAETDAKQAASVRNLRALWKQDPEGQLEKAKTDQQMEK